MEVVLFALGPWVMGIFAFQLVEVISLFVLEPSVFEVMGNVVHVLLWLVGFFEFDDPSHRRPMELLL